MSFLRWATILVVLAVLGWFSGWAVSAWTHRNDVAIAAASAPAKIKRLPTIRGEHETTQIAARAETPAEENDAAAALADKAFGTGPYRQGRTDLPRRVGGRIGGAHRPRPSRRRHAAGADPRQ